MCFPTLQWLFPFSLLFHLISSIQKLGCEPETDLPGRLQWLSLARPPLPWSQPLLFAHDCTREDLMYIAVTQQRVIIHHSHASNISLGHVFSILLKKKKKTNNNPEGTVVFSLALVIVQTSRSLGRSVPTARKTYQVLCVAAFLARHKTS